VTYPTPHDISVAWVNITQCVTRGKQGHVTCQEKTQGGSDDERKGGKRMKMSGKTRCKVRYKRVSTDLYRRDEPDRDVYIRKR